MAATWFSLIILSLLSISAFSFAPDIQAETRTAFNCSHADVMSAIAAAREGDIVNVPAGSCTWDKPLIINKGITLNGAGVGMTIITGNINDAYNGVISYRPDAAARTSNALLRITGFTIDCNSQSNGIIVNNDSALPVTQVRIDHNKIVNAGGASAGRGVYIKGSVYGVADNNEILGFTHGMDGEGLNTVTWNNLPRSYGNANNFYFEDNNLTCYSSNVFHAGGHGGRYVARYNYYKNNSTSNLFPVFDMHGNQPPDITGMMVNEIYGNDIDLGTKGARLIDQRGGMLLAFSNKIKWGSDGVGIVIREEHLDGLYPLGNSFLMHVTNSYYWSNISNGIPITKVDLTSNQYEDTHDLVQNVDFWIENTSYNGTTQRGVYCGSSLPPSCSVGDGAWITTQSCSDLTGMVGVNPINPINGTLYKCTSTNTWQDYYTPYTYPHPLRSIKNSSIPKTPENLRKVD